MMLLKLIQNRMWCVFATSLGLLWGAFGSTETTWPTSGSVTIPAGQTWVANQSDMTSVNKLTSITVTGTLVFTNCTTCPKANLLSGSGVIRKVGSSTCTFSNANAGFTGEFQVLGGCATFPTTAGVFGTTSKTTVLGGQVSYLEVLYATAIPDPSKVTVNRGFLSAKLGYYSGGVTPRWTMENLLGLHSKYLSINGGAIAIDAREYPNRLFEMSLSDLDKGDGQPSFPWGVSGGKVRVTGKLNQSLTICPNAYLGDFELTGPATYILGGTNEMMAIGESFTNTPARVLITGGAKVKQGTLPYYIGQMNEFSSVWPYPMACNHLILSNATWLASDTTITTLASLAGLRQNALYVGSYDAGILELQKDAMLSNKVVVGGGGYLGGGQYGDGAVYVGDGAQLYIRSGGKKVSNSSTLGYGGWGFMCLEEGGTIVSESVFSIGGHGRGVYHQYGGDHLHAGALNVSSANGGNGVVYLNDGLLRTEPVRNAKGSYSGYAHLYVGYYNATETTTSDGYGAVTVDGTNATIIVDIRTGTSQSSSLYACGGTGSNRAFVNLNDGGTIACDNILTGNKGKLYMNFNGGILKQTPGSRYTPFIQGQSSLVNLAVYENGMTIQGDYKDRTLSTSMPIVGHVAGGVQSIELGSLTNMAWIGSPYVYIYPNGSGEGASATCAWDPKARKITGAVVTSHGWDYVAGKVRAKLATQRITADFVTSDQLSVTLKNGAVSAITLGTEYKNMYCPYTPEVEIEGSGKGAKVAPKLSSNKLTGFTISSGGSGYTATDIRVTIKQPHYAIVYSPNAIRVADNVIGGFTAAGTKTLTVSGENSWQQWTGVDTGTLKVGAASAIPSGTELRLNNSGTLDLNSKSGVTFSGVAGTGGTVKNGNLVIVGEMKISAQKFIDEITTEINGTLDLTGVTKFIVTDSSCLEDQKVKKLPARNLIAATSVIWPSTMPTVEGTPAGWRLRKKGNGLQLSHGSISIIVFK